MTAQSRRFAAVPMAAAASSLPARSLRVLIAICASADQGGTAWPGVTEISRRTGIARRHVSGEVDRLASAGLIEVERHPGRGNVYAINYGAVSPQAVIATVTPGGDSGAGKTAPTVTSDGDALSPQTVHEQTIEQKKENTPAADATGERAAVKPVLRVVATEGEMVPERAAPFLAPSPVPADRDGGFDDFWKHYPYKVAKRTAEKAHRSALKRATAATILAGARRYAEQVAEKVARDSRAAEFIAHPATWLNGDRWADLEGAATATPSPDPAREEAAKRYNRDLAAWKEGGRAGKMPELDSYFSQAPADDRAAATARLASISRSAGSAERKPELAT